MGASWSTPTLVKPFSTFSLWSHEQSEGLLKQYQNSNFFFGIDSRELAYLTGESATVSFNVSASSLGLVHRQSGDLMCAPGTFEVELTNGVALSAKQQIVVRGTPTVLSRFPAASA